MDTSDSEVVCRRSLVHEAYKSNTLEDFRDLKEFLKMDIGNSEVVCRRNPNGKKPLALQRDAGLDSPLSLNYEAYESDTLGGSGHLKEVDRKSIPPANGQGLHNSPPPPVANVSKNFYRNALMVFPAWQGFGLDGPCVVFQLYDSLILRSVPRRGSTKAVHWRRRSRPQQWSCRTSAPCHPAQRRRWEPSNVCCNIKEAAAEGKQVGLETENGKKSPQRGSSAQNCTLVKETPSTPSEPHTTPSCLSLCSIVSWIRKVFRKALPSVPPAQPSTSSRAQVGSRPLARWLRRWISQQHSHVHQQAMCLRHLKNNLVLKQASQFLLETGHARVALVAVLGHHQLGTLAVLC
ncbi:uncharacterized protein LOC132592246 [Zootoca vivipara]|uniref:uncharacterized protein LOC132592246 n=1 Tax=Zootoca vivipara TaxID=8524 RepID=UPI00293BE4E1|nr:uncharacterized protein LOC132592246 [Zootoca vivipara]